MPFQVEIIAADGKTVLGDVKIHKSTPFLKYSNAETWRDQCVKTNAAAGRPCFSKIKTVMVRKQACADYTA